MAVVEAVVHALAALLLFPPHSVTPSLRESLLLHPQLIRQHPQGWVCLGTGGHRSRGHT